MDEKRVIRWTIMLPSKQVDRMKNVAEILGMSLSDYIRNVCLVDADSVILGSKNYNDICSFLKNNFSSIEKNIRQIESRHQLDPNVWDRYKLFHQAIRERFIHDVRLKYKIDIPKDNDGEKKRIFLMITEAENGSIKENKTAILSRLERPISIYDVDGSQWKILQQVVKRVGNEVNQIAYLSNAGRWDQIAMNVRLREVLQFM